MIILLLALHVLTVDAYSIEHKSPDNLVDSIRRQLMENNYDYESSKENEPRDNTLIRNDPKDTYRPRNIIYDDRDKNDMDNNNQEMRSNNRHVADQPADAKHDYKDYNEGDNKKIKKEDELPTGIYQVNIAKDNEKGRTDNPKNTNEERKDYQRINEFVSQKKTSPEHDYFYVRQRSRGSQHNERAKQYNKSKEINTNIIKVKQTIHSSFQIGIKGEKQGLTTQTRVHSTTVKYMPSMIMATDMDDYLPKYGSNIFEEGPEFRSNKRGKPKEKRHRAHHVVSKKDLLYYVDDEQLTRRRYDRRDNYLNNSEMYATEQDTEESNHTTTPKVKYKLLQIRERNPTRRNMQVRRFLEERNDDGVTFIKLDGGPFPQFKLPRSRRQYMADDDYLISDMKDLPEDGGNEKNNTAADAITDRTEAWDELGHGGEETTSSLGLTGDTQDIPSGG